MVLEEKFGKPQSNKPILPLIANKEAIYAQDSLNSILNRFDISSNALPTKEGKILVILVHGYLSSKWLWIDPYWGSFGWLREYRNDPKPKNYGWHSTPPPSHMYVPFDISFSPLVFPEGVFNTLMRKGFEVLTFSQKDPTGDIDLSAKELDIILKGVQEIYGKRRLVLVGHSRGGICIRRYLDLFSSECVEKVITLATPHYGSKFLNVKIIKEPAIKFLNEGKIKQIWDISDKREIRDLSYEQMASNSEFLLSLRDIEKNLNIEYISAAGSNPTFLHIYTWAISRRFSRKSILKMFSSEKQMNQKIGQKNKIERQYHWIAKPTKLLTIFDERLLREFQVGDGLVSLKNAILKESIRKYNINANHEEMAVCDDVKKLILKELKVSFKRH